MQFPPDNYRRRFNCVNSILTSIWVDTSAHRAYTLAATSSTDTGGGGSKRTGRTMLRRAARRPIRPLYTPPSSAPPRRHALDAGPGLLAPLQFLVFLVSLALVLRYLATGEGLPPPTPRSSSRPLLLYAIMVTGSIWEKAVFGRYLFAPAFFWEDVVSMLVLALHTAYLVALLLGAARPARPDAPGARRLCHLRRQRRAVPPEAARRPARRRPPAGARPLEAAR